MVQHRTPADDPVDKKPPSEPKPPARAVAQPNPHGDANVIGSPDTFLADRYRDQPAGTMKILQVKCDGPDRAYVITEGAKVGYFELAEGMSRADAEAALRGAYDGTAVVL